MIISNFLSHPKSRQQQYYMLISIEHAFNLRIMVLQTLAPNISHEGCHAINDIKNFVKYLVKSHIYCKMYHNRLQLLFLCQHLYDETRSERSQATGFLYPAAANVARTSTKSFPARWTALTDTVSFNSLE